MGHRCHALQVMRVDYQLVILFCLAAVWRKRTWRFLCVNGWRGTGENGKRGRDCARPKGLRIPFGIVLGAKAPAHSLSPRRRGPCKALIQAGGRRPPSCFRFRPLTKASFRRGRNQKQLVVFATSCVSTLCGE